MPQQKMVICAYTTIGQSKAAANRSMEKRIVFPFQMLYMNHCIENMLFIACRLSHQKSRFRTIA